jgi:hypothetical protein
LIHLEIEETADTKSRWFISRILRGIEVSFNSELKDSIALVTFSLFPTGFTNRTTEI